LEEGDAPNFTEKPIIRPDADSNRLFFECKILSIPKPIISWYRDFNEIKSKGKFV
jgi:hypothetical protein